MFKPHIIPKTQTTGFIIFSSLMLSILSAVVLGLFLNHLQIQEGYETAPTRRIQDLVTLLKQAETKRTTLEKEVSRMRKKVLSMQDHNNPLRTGHTPQDPELQRLYQLAGFTPITGPGIVITLQDGKKPPAASEAHQDPNAGKLQADDILKMINELKAAGATAIAINDQRLVVTSEIVTAGPSISVNQTRLRQPVVIMATGDPATLEGALRIRGGILEYLDFFNIQVSLERKTHLQVPAYKGPISS